MRALVWPMIGALALVGLGCGEDGASSGGGGDGAGAATSVGSGAGSTSVGSTGSSMKPPPGPSAMGWASDFTDPGAVSCGDDAAAFEAAGAAEVTVEGATLYAAYEQVGDNQNPIVARFDGGELVWCVIHESEGPDGRALGVTWNGGEHAYVVYTIVGGGSSLEGKGGWLDAYAPGAISGGGPKVSYVGRVQADDGALSSGTFVIAVKSDNEVNSHAPAGPITVLEDGNVEFVGESAHKPIDADGKSSMDCTDYPFDSRYRLSADLSAIVCADCSNCSSQSPCD